MACVQSLQSMLKDNQLSKVVLLTSTHELEPHVWADGRSQEIDSNYRQCKTINFLLHSIHSRLINICAIQLSLHFKDNHVKRQSMYQSDFSYYKKNINSTLND